VAENRVPPVAPNPVVSPRIGDLRITGNMRSMSGALSDTRHQGQGRHQHHHMVRLKPHPPKQKKRRSWQGRWEAGRCSVCSVCTQTAVQAATHEPASGTAKPSSEIGMGEYCGHMDAAFSIGFIISSTSTAGAPLLTHTQPDDDGAIQVIPTATTQHTREHPKPCTWCPSWQIAAATQQHVHMLGRTACFLAYGPPWWAS